MQNLKLKFYSVSNHHSQSIGKQASNLSNKQGQAKKTWEDFSLFHIIIVILVSLLMQNLKLKFYPVSNCHGQSCWDASEQQARVSKKDWEDFFLMLQVADLRVLSPVDWLKL